jgi:hypothetical protein
MRLRARLWPPSLAVLVLSAACDGMASRPVGTPQRPATPDESIPERRSIAKGAGVCRRTSKHRATILLARAPGHSATLVVAPDGMLKVVTKGGVDPCGGTLAEIGTLLGDGSAERDTLILDRSRGLEGSRLRFTIFLAGGRDTLRLLGDRNSERIRFSEFESSSPWVERFSWRRVGQGATFNVERLILQGRGGGDLITGKPVTTSRFTRSIDIQMITTGGPGSDRVIGGRKRDVLRGSAGNDYLRGGKAPDLARGGTGLDDCSGGPADDVVVGCELQP